MLTLPACLPKDQSAEIAKLTERLEELETQLEVATSKVESSADENVVGEKMEDLTRRMTEFEEARGELQTALLGEFEGQNEKLQRMFRGFNEMHEMIQTGQTWAAIGIGYQGHAVARTRHGSFLIELDHPEEVEDGYKIVLRIGNPTGLHVHQFKIFGNYGSPPPDVSDAKDYTTMIQTIDSWEASLKTFESSYVTSLEPNKWTRVGLVVPAERLVDLQFIRFRMVIDRASLVATDFEQGMAQFGVDYEGAVILETKHGTFPLTVRDKRKVSGGWELDLLVGNPLGMTITNAKLVGAYGPEPPKLIEGEDHQKYSERLVHWDQSLRPFESSVASIEEPLTMFYWNPVTIKMHTENITDLAHIRARLEILNVSLQNPQ